MATLPPAKIPGLLAQLHADPGLPSSNPTEAFWQIPVHEKLSAHQSSSLPTKTDYAIIGSGITGCSVAKHLLDHDLMPKDARVVVFEARTLCSGATGRNGGALTSFAGYKFDKLIQKFGEAEATKIGRFAHGTLEKMHVLGNSSPHYQNVSEVRRLRNVVGFADHEEFESIKASFRKYEELVPECRLNLEIISAEVAREQYNLKDVVGAILFNNGAFWPYRLVTAIWADLLATHGNRLAIETNTPVTKVDFDASSKSHPYIITTPRGITRAAHVIHATNGYGSHLLPRLRGKLFPCRGTMSAQAATPAFGSHGAQRGWAFRSTGNYNTTTDMLELGLYYSNQNPRTNDIFIGGDKVKVDQIFVSDDSTISPGGDDNLKQLLPKFFAKGWKTGQTPEIRKIWSGIMGFTSDETPLVGKLPASASGREGGGEWIAAGFNGYGMPQCWSAGEAVAKMLLGEDVSAWLPDVFLCTEARLRGMSAEMSLQKLTGWQPPSQSKL